MPRSRASLTTGLVNYWANLAGSVFTSVRERSAPKMVGIRGRQDAMRTFRYGGRESPTGSRNLKAALLYMMGQCSPLHAGRRSHQSGTYDRGERVYVCIGGKLQKAVSRMYQHRYSREMPSLSHFRDLNDFIRLYRSAFRRCSESSINSSSTSNILLVRFWIFCQNISAFS